MLSRFAVLALGQRNQPIAERFFRTEELLYGPHLIPFKLEVILEPVPDTEFAREAPTRIRVTLAPDPAQVRGVGKAECLPSAQHNANNREDPYRVARAGLFRGIVRARRIGRPFTQRQCGVEERDVLPDSPLKTRQTLGLRFAGAGREERENAGEEQLVNSE